LFKAIQYDDEPKDPSNELCKELGLENLLTFTDYEKMIDDKFDQLLDVVVVPTDDTRPLSLSGLDIQVNHMKEFVKIVQQSESSFPEELSKLEDASASK
jgi:hypothetical protein